MPGLRAQAGEFLDMLYPPVCVNCHVRIPDQKVWLCGSCYDKLSYIPEQHCPKCGYPIEGEECFNCYENTYVFRQAVSVFLYENAAKALVHGLKYSGLAEIADWFANQMYKVLLHEKPLTGVDYVTAVPLHKVRRRERGYNQSDLIAKALAERMNREFTDKALVRRTYTTSQTLLDSTERRKNIKGAFRIGRLDPHGKSFLLIDDVFTTGTTVNEASRTLLNAGAKEVFVMTACHGL
jgi:competence protein ComFC